jgi:hypothetical protein
MKSTFARFWFYFVVSVPRHIPLNAGRSVIHCGPSVGFTYLVIMPLSESQFSGFAQHQLSALSVSRPASARLLANLI